MKYIYFKSERGNFGDDLNAWLWPKIFGDIPEDISKDFVFWGIGSILFNENKLIKDGIGKKNLVFGTGIRPSPNYKPFTMNGNWDIRFLRGPLSVSALGNRFSYITDAAYALRQLDNFSCYMASEKKYEVSLMPYYRSMGYFDCKKICAKLGYHYISPFSEDGVEFTIKEIAATKHLITEAMHGAIVADLLRTPWHRYILTTPYTEGAMVSEFKWNDWLMSVNIHGLESTVVKFYRRSVLHGYLKKFTRDFLSLEILYKPKVKADLLFQLASVNKYCLSDDEIIKDIDKKIANQIKELKIHINSTA